MTIKFVDAKKDSIEWILSRLNLGVVPEHDVDAHMGQVSDNDFKNREMAFLKRNPIIGFFLKYIVIITILELMLSVLLLPVVKRIVANTDPSDKIIDFIFGCNLVVWTYGLVFWLILRQGKSPLPVEYRFWEKTLHDGYISDAYIVTIRSFVREHNLQNIRVFVYTHPSVSDRWYSVSGVGDSGNIEEYFLLHTPSR